MDMYIRLKPYSPRQGHDIQRLHWNGNLFTGGARPTWYKVPTDIVEAARDLKQDSGAPMFDIVSDQEKVAIDQKENALHMAALGIAAATVAAPMQAAPVDLTHVRRGAAIPAAPVVPQARSEAIPHVAPSGAGFEEALSGDLSVTDLK